MMSANKQEGQQLNKEYQSISSKRNELPTVEKRQLQQLIVKKQLTAWDLEKTRKRESVAHRQSEKTRWKNNNTKSGSKRNRRKTTKSNIPRSYTRSMKEITGNRRRKLQVDQQPKEGHKSNNSPRTTRRLNGKMAPREDQRRQENHQEDNRELAPPAVNGVEDNERMMFPASQMVGHDGTTDALYGVGWAEPEGDLWVYIFQTVYWKQVWIQIIRAVFYEVYVEWTGIQQRNDRTKTNDVRRWMTWIEVAARAMGHQYIPRQFREMYNAMHRYLTMSGINRQAIGNWRFDADRERTFNTQAWEDDYFYMLYYAELKTPFPVCNILSSTAQRRQWTTDHLRYDRDPDFRGANYPPLAQFVQRIRHLEVIAQVPWHGAGAEEDDEEPEVPARA